MAYSMVNNERGADGFVWRFLFIWEIQNLAQFGSIRASLASFVQWPSTELRFKLVCVTVISLQYSTVLFEFKYMITLRFR